MTDRIPVILDTDIGSDIDDAFCLANLLAQPRCELVGITTVSGEDPRVRASLADAVCRSAGRTDVPIHSGASVRMDSGAVVQPAVPQAAFLPAYAHRRPADFAANTAVPWLHKTFRPDICAWARGTVAVELASPRLEGLTHFDRRADGPHEVAETVAADRFFDEYVATVARRG